MKFITLHGMRFCRDDDTGYYRNGTHSKLAHRHVWECERGPIPEGWHVHHIDRDRGNNAIENLECMTASDHQALHHAEEGFALKLRRAMWFDSIRPKALDWHKTTEGRAWHSQHARDSFARMEERIYACDQCGAQFSKKPVGSIRFCAPKCAAAYRRASGVDDVQRNCTECGKTFSVNRYKSTATCSKACTNRARDSLGAMMKGLVRDGQGRMTKPSWLS